MVVIKEEQHVSSYAMKLALRKKHRSELSQPVNWTPINCQKPSSPKQKHRVPKQPPTTSPSTHHMLTRSVTTKITRDAVVDTNELLEAIFLQVSNVDLINFRRVNKVWNHVIMASRKIQQKLFLLPEESAPVWLFDKGTSYLRPYGPSDADMEFGNHDKFLKKAWTNRQCRMRPSVLNPVLAMLDPESRRPALKSRAALCESIRFVFSPKTKLHKTNIYYHMFLCQPPVKEVQLVVNYRRKPDASNRRRRFPMTRIGGNLHVKNPEGVTLGDVLRQLHKQVVAQEVFSPIWADYKIDLRKLKFQQKTTIWMLGAIFVSQDEYDAVEGNREIEKKKDYSPLCKEIMNREKFGVEPDRFYNWFSKADQEWVAREEMGLVARRKILNDWS